MKFAYAFTFLLFLGCLLMGLPVQGQCICTADYTPVCGTNGVTYSNRCRMSCAGAKFKHVGHCEEST